MAELRTAMARPIIYPSVAAGRLLPEPAEAMAPPDMIELTERYLGRGELERQAMMILAKPQAGMSIREMCRERIRWSRSRASLYRWAARGKCVVARRLNEDGVAVNESPRH